MKKLLILLLIPLTLSGCAWFKAGNYLDKKACLENYEDWKYAEENLADTEVEKIFFRAASKRAKSMYDVASREE